jgi:hypothetical protein
MRALAALALAAVIAHGPAAAAPFGGRFDGSWGIQVLTERGECDPVYRYYIVIQNNAVHVRSMMGEVAPEPSGRINPSGRIDTRIGAPDDPVGIRGKLEGAAGSGRWTAPARGCAGRWVAERRG